MGSEGTSSPNHKPAIVRGRLAGIATALGGFWFVVYFAKIGYFPDADIPSLGLLLFGSAMVGGAWFLALACIFIAPGLIWQEFLFDDAKFKDLAFDDEERGYKQRLQWIGLPGVPLIVGVLLAVLYKSTPLLIVGASLVFIAFAFLIWRVDGLHVKEFWKWAHFCGAWVFGWLLFMIPLAVIARLAVRQESQDLATRIILMVGSIIVVAVINIMGTPPPKEVVSGFPEWARKRLWSIIAGAAVVVFILVQADKLLVLPEGTMRILGIGGVPCVSIIVTEEGKNVLDGYGFRYVEIAGQTYRVENLKLLSRIGNEYFFEFTSSEQKAFRFTIPKRAVLSWRVDIQKSSNSQREAKEQSGKGCDNARSEETPGAS